jgi:hypothetical protein
VEEFNDILERMQDARERWSTVSATLLKWRHLALGEEALDRFIAQEDSRSVGRLTRPGDSDEDERRRRLVEEPPFYETELRVWARKPYRWRIETEERQGRSFVDVGDKAWRPDLMYHGYGPEEFDPPDLLPLDDNVAWIFDPRIALTTFDIQVLGHTTHAGREAVRLLALPGEEMRTSSRGPLGSARSGWGANDYELLADDERGVLLRWAARLEGQEFDKLEVTEIAFDEELSEDIFDHEDRFY